MGTKAWPSGEGEMAGRICTYNWAATPLGPIPSWPQCLKTAVELMLASGFPTSIQWGQEAIFLYNDAKARILGHRHPAALGQPGPRESVFRRVTAGESVVFADQRYVVQEEGGEREIWVDHLASPIRDETGAIDGLWTVLINVTARVQAERQHRQAEDALRESEARQAFLLGLSDALRSIADPSAIVATATRMAVEHFGASRCCYAEFWYGEVLLRGCWIHPGVQMPERFAFAELATVAEGYLAGRAAVTDDIESDPRFTEEERSRLRAAGIAAFVCVPVRRETVFGIQSAAPRVWRASEVELIREAGDRTLYAVRRARAEAALRDSEDRMKSMVAELQHRTHNLMAVLQSIVAHTLAVSEDLDSFKIRIDERLIALSRVQRLLSRSDQEPVTIGLLVQLELDAPGSDGPPGRIEVRGPEVRIRNSIVQMLALALHELTIDARKHGALSTDQGRLQIGWQVEQIRGVPWLRLSWIEAHPVCVAVKRDPRGLGRELIERALPYSLNAETCYELDGSGLRCTISLPLTKEGPKESGA